MRARRGGQDGRGDVSPRLPAVRTLDFEVDGCVAIVCIVFLNGVRQLSLCGEGGHRTLGLQIGGFDLQIGGTNGKTRVGQG